MNGDPQRTDRVPSSTCAVPHPDARAATERSLVIDAAWGGFHRLFADHDWGFADAAVDTLIDPHKGGRAAIPAGGLPLCDTALLDALAVETTYPESRTRATLAGTRSGTGVASAVAAMEALWSDGYRVGTRRAGRVARWFATELIDRGIELVDTEPDLPTGLFDRLREAGQRLSRTGADGARGVVSHVTGNVPGAFLADLGRLASEGGQ